MLSKEIKKVSVLLIFSVAFITLLTFYSVYTMKNDYFNSIGRRASGIAIVTANNLKLSNEEVRRLISLNFNDLLEDPANIEFENHMRAFMKEVGVKYIYIMHQLPPEKVKYTVQSEKVNYYGAPAGTELNVIYLLDAVIDEQTRVDDTDGQGYTDNNRYTYLNQNVLAIYNRKEAVYTMYDDEWGVYLTGFAPVYSTEGDYIGVLGVDIFIEEYIGLVNRRIIVFLIFNVISIVMAVILFASFRKIYKTKKDADLFKEKSYFDDMTGFLNRRTLNEESGKYWEKGKMHNQALTVIMMDIDHFKSFNDRYGHIIGDEVISKVSSVIKLSIRENEDLVFRYGGDEFMILLFGAEQNIIEAIAQRISKHVKKIVIKDVDESITLSFGIASALPTDQFTLNHLIHKADQALYISKQNGRDGIHQYDECAKV